MDLDIHAALFVACALYAAILERYKRHLEPNYTWLEVAIGNGLVLGAGLWRATRHADWSGVDAVLAVMLAFVVGGAPVILWQIWRSQRSDKHKADLLARNTAQRNALKGHILERELPHGTD